MTNVDALYQNHIEYMIHMHPQIVLYPLLWQLNDIYPYVSSP